MSQGTTEQQRTIADEFFAATHPPPPDELLLQQLERDRPRLAKPGQPFDFARLAHRITAIAQEQERVAGLQVDRTVRGEARAGLKRGVLGLAEAGAGLGLAATNLAQKVVGRNAVTRLAENFFVAELAGVALLKAKIPRSPDEQFTLRRTIGFVSEVAPQFGQQAAVAFATGGGSIPLQIAMFMGTGGAQATGLQYVQTLQETGDPDKAAIEAGAAGLIVTGLNVIPGFTLFRRVPASRRFFLDAARRVSTRMVGGAVGESLEEMSEAVLLEAVAGMVRDEPERFAKILEGDPEFWMNVLEQGLIGAIAGVGAGVAVGGVDVRRRVQQIIEVRQATSGTVQQAHEVLVALEQAREALRRRVPRRAPREAPAVAPEEAVEAAEAAPEAVEAAAVGAEPEVAVTPEEVAEPETAEEQAAPLITRPRARAEPEVQTPRQRIKAVLDRLRQAGRSQRRSTAARQQEQVTDELSQARTQIVRGQVAVEEIRRRLIDAVRGRPAREGRAAVPAAIPDPKVSKTLLNQLGKARTRGQLSKAMRTILTERTKVLKTKAVNRLKRRVGQLGEPKKLRTRASRAVSEVIRGVRFAALNPNMKRRLEALREFIQNEPDATLPQRLLDRIGELDKVPVTDLTTDEVMALAEAVESAIRNERLVRRISRERNRRDLRQLAQGVAAEITRTVGRRLRLDPRGRVLRSRFFRTSIGGLVRNMFGALENMDLDGIGELLGGSEDSLTHRVLHDDVEAAQTEGLGAYQESIDALAKVLSQIGLELGSVELAEMSRDLSGRRTILGRTLAAMGIQTEAGRAEPTTHEITLKDGEVLKIVAAERMGLILLLADSETFDLVVFRGVPIRFRGEPSGKQRRLFLDDVQAIEASMTDAERQIVRFMLDHVNGPVKQRMSEHSLSRRGFDITKPDTWWSRHRIIEGSEPDVNAANLSSAIFRRVGLEPSIAKKRGDDAKSPIEVRDAFTDFNNIVWTTSMFTAMEQPIATARAVLRTKAVRNVLQDSPAGRATQAINTIYDQIAREITGAPSDRGMVEGNFAPLVRRVSVGLLGLNPRIGLYQFVSVLMLRNEIESSFVARALAERAAFSDKVDGRMMEHPWFRMRFEFSTVGLINEGTQIAADLLGFSQAGEGPMFMIRAIDRWAIRVAWRAAELKAEAQAKREGLSEQQQKDLTWQIAQRIVVRTQPAFDSLHIATRAVEAKQRTFLKFANFFRSQRNKLMGMNMRAVYRMRRNPNLKTIADESLNIATATIFNGLAIASIRSIASVSFLALLVKAATGTLDREDEEKLAEEPKKLAADFVRTVGGTPFLGGILAEPIAAMLGERAFDFEFSPVEGLINDTIRGLGRMHRRATEGDIIMTLDGATDLAAALAALEGIPAPFIVRELKNLLKALQQEQEPEFRFSPP